ncbi:hypothetical protein [uncultured Erythrobacter sp.]|nr:hypothetical protein [uncultured Erythrobacter sp.]
MNASIDLGSRMLAAASALVVTAIAMATAIVPASPTTSLLIGGLA